MAWAEFHLLQLWVGLLAGFDSIPPNGHHAARCAAPALKGSKGAGGVKSLGARAVIRG